MVHTSVEMVNPGGTGNPALVISARPAPLPPSTSFILPLPSALPPPNEYTYLVVDFLVSFVSVSGRVIVAIIYESFCDLVIGKFGNFAIGIRVFRILNCSITKFLNYIIL